MDLKFYSGKQKEKSFTLIELLVVIAIIGLLSSIVLVSMQGVRGKARIAKGLEFSQSVHNALGANAVGWWGFETIEAGNQVIDGSGYNNHGIVNGATLVPGLEQLGNALNFDGASDYVNCGTNNNLNITGPVTVEAWIYLRTDAPVGNYRSIYQKSLQIWLRVDPGKIATCYFYQGAGYKSVRLTNTLALNTWYHVVVTYDNTAAKFYVNGVDDTGTNNVSSGGINSSAASVLISVNSTVNAWDGLIDEVRVYSQALSATEIQKHYVEGLGRHQYAKK